MVQAAYIDPVQAQDGLRTVRNFVSLLSGAVNDQSYAGEDGWATNSPGGFMVQGQNGVAIEGKPYLVATPDGAAIGLPRGLLIVGALVVAYLALK